MHNSSSVADKKHPCRPLPRGRHLDRKSHAVAGNQRGQIMEETASENPPSFLHLQEIVATLRGERGCPWDIRQTPETMTRYLLEECEELVEAITQKDEGAICEETGDVLFILAFLISIYTERNQFTASDVFSRIIEKMIRRHPHVFAGQQVSDEQALREQWQRIKLQEKRSTKTP
jgi:uncharacterized protein YabN with tetrapyrrole methylase and pyrophosphatase domain